jgi:hypothetical protein
VTMEQQTNYPWDGAVKLIVTTEAPTDFALHLRIPAWAQGATLKINGTATPSDKLETGYLPIKRSWKSGDVVELNLPMQPRRVYSNPNVWADKDRVAIARGPMVYCLEDDDNPVSVHKIVIPKDAKLAATDFKANELGGVVKIVGKGINAENGQPIDFAMVPYAVWDNRSHDGGMLIMAPEIVGAKAGPVDGGRATCAKVTSSHKNNSDKESALNDGIFPKSWNGQGGSKDTSIPRFTWGDQKGTQEWVEYEFPKPTQISRSDIFWAADGKDRDFPQAFHLETFENGQWKPVQFDADYAKAIDVYSDYHFTDVRFTPVTTTKLRLVVQLKPGKSAGILEWRLPLL